MLHKVKDQVERPLVLAKVDGLLFVGDDFLELDDVLVLDLAQDLDLSDGGDWETLFLVLETNLL